MKQINRKIFRVLAGGSMAAMIAFSSMTALAATNTACNTPSCALQQVTGRNQTYINTAADAGKSNEQIAKDSGKLDQYRQKVLDIKSEILARLVKSGTITQKQANAVLSALKTADTKTTAARTQTEDKYSNSTLTSVLKTLVSKKTISQKQADAIRQAFANADTAVAQTAQKEQSVTIKQVQNALSSLVKAKKLTQTQADAVLKAVRAQATDSSITITKLQTALNTLVKAKTITSSMASNILGACK